MLCMSSCHDEGMSEKHTRELDVTLGVPDLLATLGDRVCRDWSKAWDGGRGGRCQEGGGDEGGVMHLELKWL